MNIEALERLITERVHSLSPTIASVEVIHTTPINLPDHMTGDAYVGLIIVGAGESIPDAHITAQGVSSFKGSVHKSTLAVSYFVLVIGEKVHIYLENQGILDFIRHAGQ